MKRLEEIFTKEYLQKLERLSLSLRQRLSVSGYSGGRKSHGKGSSLEFSDFRDYEAGDDLRLVDWNSFGRFGKLYIKLFMEEKQAEINLFLDCSRSMESGDKFVQAKALVASFAYIGFCSGDRVNVFLWNEKIAMEQRGLRGKNSLGQLLAFLDEVEAQGETDTVRAALLCGKLGRGISLVVSDFFTERSPGELLAILQGKKQEVFFVQMLSKEEEHPNLGQAVRLVDAETAESRDFQVTGQILADYAKALGEHRGALGELCHRRGAGFYAMNEETSLFYGLGEILR